MEIFRHGRRKPCTEVTKVNSKMLEKISYAKSDIKEGSDKCATTPLRANAPIVAQTTKKKVNTDFCGIFGTDMELLP